jgi:signal peptidase I
MAKISRKLRKEAEEMLRVAEKVYAYRSDILEAERREALRAKTDRLDACLKKGSEADEASLGSAMETLEAEMQQCGGTYYPRNSIHENVEVLLVAAILAIGIRMFFIQPFRIPTNSMYPTYNGMTFEVFAKEEERPPVFLRPFRSVLFGASRVEAGAPVDGEVVIPVFPSTAKEGYSLPGKAVKARKWFGILPTIDAQYPLYVGGKQVLVNVPLDFQLSKVIWARYGLPTEGKLSLGPGGVWLYHTGVQAKAGEKFLSFDILLGDQLFVDRMSYHFLRPDVGDPIVFRTDRIPGMSEGERGKYYIKRLVGTAGDTLQVKGSTLYRNGAPITGSEAFDLNAKRVGEYEGYLPSISQHDLMPLDEPYTVPANSCIGMGDNSDESADSRVWGPMPENALVGKALLIYYPFTKHVGMAK